MEIVDLIKKYVGDYDKQEHPFLLFDIAHVNENDHTRVLLSILKYNNYQFLPTFLQALGAPALKSIEGTPTDQEPAIGNKGKGYIDLYFEYRSQNDQTEKFIIENKIYGAGDTDCQLARYIATVIDPKMNNKQFNEIWEQWANNNSATFRNDVKVDFNHIHVVYLTLDGSKKPSIKSLPMYFGGRSSDDCDFDEERMNINYYPINYVDDIIPWIENDVLPNMPYSDNGIAIAGIRQYLESLKGMFNSQGNSMAIMDYVKDIGGSDIDKYNKIISAMDEIKSLTSKNTGDLKKQLEVEGVNLENSPELQSLTRELRTYAMSIFANDGEQLGGDWKLYFTPSFTLLYRQRWADLDTKKYSIPSIYFQTSTYNLLNQKDITWKLTVDHLDCNNISDKEKCYPFKLGNHDKTAYHVIIDKECPQIKDITKSASRKDYYKSLKNKLEYYISVVNEVVDGIWDEYDNQNRKNFQEKVLENLAAIIKEK